MGSLSVSLCLSRNHYSNLLFQPAHQVAKFCTNWFDWMNSCCFAMFFKEFLTIFRISQEFISEFTRLNVSLDLFHSFFSFWSNYARACIVITIFCCVRNGVTHFLETTFVDKVYDQFHFMQAFEVSVYRFITSFC